MIERFPRDLSGMAAVLASALATRISWLRPFGVTDAGQLRSPWSKQVCDALTVAGTAPTKPMLRVWELSACIPRSVPANCTSPRLSRVEVHRFRPCWRRRTTSPAGK
ncbi:hypothetical protein I551_4452 [Mycobacterium ulcerans str. Harvey]|uniref:Uncharacterized protein n=1 Tax=Mycobacterium ulcerans str. Harvey TaxID=1299332 RepID=A0ABN0QW90_MYCUL|nr:hypothetical protein I551_4452 [Mycobacterium ulcerans str. Harvey]